MQTRILIVDDDPVRPDITNKATNDLMEPL